MNGPSPTPGARLADVYDEAMPEVFAYLRGRCGSRELAEELTSATFVQAAVSSRDPHTSVTVPWLITVARHKLIDHWRRMAVVDRSEAALERETAISVEPWDAVLDQQRSAEVMAALSARHRSALTLRYLDDLPVAACAELLNLSEHATESLLVRARRAFRAAYEHSGGHDV